MQRSFRGLYSCLTVVLLWCLACQRPQKPEPQLNTFQKITGEGWLAWSLAERTEYVDTYLDAYGSGYGDGCRNAENIFGEGLRSEKGVHSAKLPYEKGDENSVDIPRSHCMNRQAKHSRRHRGSDALLVSPYPEIITEMYEKHTDSRSTPYSLLLMLLRDGGAQTADDLYKGQLGNWPNTQNEPL